MRKLFPDYDTFVPVPPLVQAWLVNEPCLKAKPLSVIPLQPRWLGHERRIFELKASEPAGWTCTPGLSCETDHFEDYSLKLQCNSF